MKALRILIVATITITVISGCQSRLFSTGSSEPDHLRLATTTSTYDSGLLDAIIPNFEAEHNYEVEIIAVGTGQAIALAEAGDADVLLVHARAREEAFVAAGFGTERFDVMYNDFVLLGAPSNPAEISHDTGIVAAFEKIADVQAPFISRGDDSGTHTRERSIWEQAGLDPSGDWYREAGQGMGAVLTMADEQGAYTLSDRGTYIARMAEGLELTIIVEGDPLLTNPYSVIPINPEIHPHTNMEGAQLFVDWLTSAATQESIAAFEVDGQQLFFPNSLAYHQAQD